MSQPEVVIKCPKGMRDWSPDLMAVRETIFPIITDTFKKHGAVGLDTPCFELKSTLTGKYGEDSKLIYDLADQGGELLAARYDLTVPFARHVAENGITNMTRYQIGKVYRRDQPVMTKGRFREFFQCDFDIAGSYDLMMPDAHCIKIVTEILDALPWLGKYTVKLNHRKLLDGIFEYSGVPEDKLRTICSSLDKLDKTPWLEVFNEMLDKGITAQAAENIGHFVCHKGNMEQILSMLNAQSDAFLVNPNVKQAIEEMTILAGYLNALNLSNVVSFDLSLARGLDYYTGMIMETVLHDSQVGSIAGGGRYDNLIGMFCKRQVPSVGFSIGIERILAAVKDKLGKNSGKSTQVVVCTVPIPESVSVRFHILDELWKAGIPSELIYRENPKIRAQLSYASEIGAKWAIIVGSTELENNVVQLKNLDTKEGITVSLAEAIEKIKSLQNNSLF